MRLTFFVVWKAWASEPVRTALTLLGVAVGVAVVIAIHVVDHNTIQSAIRRENPEYGLVDFVVTPKDATRSPESVLGELGEVPGVAHAAVLRHERFLSVARIDRGEESVEQVTPLGAIDLFGLWPVPSRAFDLYNVTAGSDLLGSEDSVLVGEAFAEKHGIGVGAVLQLSTVRRQRPGRCIDGVRSAPVDDNVAQTIAPRVVRVAGLVADERLAGKNEGAVLFGTYTLASALSPSATSVGHATFQVDAAYGADTDVLEQALSARYAVSDQRAMLPGEAADERAFRNGVKVLGGLALVLGMFVVFQTLSQGLVQRLRQLGILRALGTRRSALAGIFFVDAVALGVIGSLLGVLLGLVLAWVMAACRLTTLGVGKQVTTFEIPVVPVLWTLGLGIGFTLAGAGFPLWKARNLPVQKVLAARGLGDGEEGEFVLQGVDRFLFLLLVLVLPIAYFVMTPLLGDTEVQWVLAELYVLALVFGVLLLTAPRIVRVLSWPLLWALGLFRSLRLPAFLVRRTVARDTSRYAASMCGLGIVFVAWIALQSITMALRADIDQFQATALSNRGFVHLPSTPVQELRDLARDVPSAQRIDPMHGPATLDGHQVVAMATADIAFHGGFDELGSEAAERFDKERCLLVSRRFAHLRRVKAGDVLQWPTDDGLERYTVLGVTDQVGFYRDERAWAVTAPRWLREDFCIDDTRSDHFVLTAAEDSNSTVALDDLVTVLGQRNRPTEFGKSEWDLSEYWRNDVTKDFVVFHVLLAMILGLAVVGLMNQMTLAAIGRAREIGVLRALSMGRAQLRGIFAVEAVVIAFGATLVAVGLGPLLGRLVVAGLHAVTGLDTPYRWPYVMLALVPVLAFGLATLASWLPATRALKVDPAQAVRYQ